MGFNIGNLLKSVAGVASPILSVLTGINALRQGKNATAGANASNDTLNTIVQQYLQSAGNSGNLAGQLTGAITPNLGLLSDEAYAGLEDPYSERNLQGYGEQYAEDQQRQLNDALASAAHSSYGNGIVDSDVTRNQRLLASLNTAKNVADFRRNLSIQGGVQRYANAKAKEDAQVQRTMSLFPVLQGQQGLQLSGIGGAANVATGNRDNSNNQANMYAQSIGQAVKAISSAGQIGKANTGANAGNNRMGTNQAGTNVYDTLKGVYDAPTGAGGSIYNGGTETSNVRTGNTNYAPAYISTARPGGATETTRRYRFA